jgi:hypothetical protein
MNENKEYYQDLNAAQQASVDIMSEIRQQLINKEITPEEYQVRMKVEAENWCIGMRALMEKHNLINKI